MVFDGQRKWADRPPGMRDMYPGQAKHRRLVETKLLEQCDAHGFELVSCGAFEYADTLLRGRSLAEAENWVRLFDTAGRTVALRPELTPSIARMASPLLQSGRTEIKWCYGERVYHRTDDPASLSLASGQAAESTQVGVEWIGTRGSSVDATILQICESGLNALGVTDGQMVLSHAQFAPVFLETCGVPAVVVADLLDALVRGDYVGFRQAVAPFEPAGNGQDTLQQLASLNPFEPSTLTAHVQARWQTSAAGAKAQTVWDELVELAGILRQMDLRTGVVFDLTLNRDLSYYTGMVFEVFVKGVGAPVALGGRYDGLLAQFGAPASAIGFAYEVERLVAVQSDRGQVEC